MKMKQAAEQFLTGRRIAVTGVSRTPKGHGSNTVYQRLRQRGYDVIAINPHTAVVAGDPCYPDLAAVPGRIDGVVIGTRPEHAEATMSECVALGIGSVWMHRALGAGSVSAAATALGRRHGITVIEGGCPCMFGAASDPGHKLLRAVLTPTHAVPREV
ncbi:MAG: CoA-binding protein [Frankiales bacterium]|jgi:predicted CoA-binding protein|nr:CoA-binding protein [Frankiales bacterium]